MPTSAAPTTPATTTRSRNFKPTDTREEHRRKLVGFFAGDPDWRKGNETPEQAAERILAAEDLEGTPGQILLRQIGRTARKLEGQLANLFEEHGPDSTSALAEFIRRYKAETFWHNLRAMHWNVLNGVEFLESESPGL